MALVCPVAIIVGTVPKRRRNMRWSSPMKRKIVINIKSIAIAMNQTANAPSAKMLVKLSSAKSHHQVKLQPSEETKEAATSIAIVRKIGNVTPKKEEDVAKNYMTD